MRESRAQHSIPRRASATQSHQQGIQPPSRYDAQDQLYRTTLRQRPAPQAVPEEEDDDIYEQPTRSSARRYRPTGEGTKAMAPYAPPPPKQRVHWLVFVGAALLTMLVGWVLLTLLGLWWQGVQDTWTYGNPRTYQIDENVGHYGRVSHFIALNLHGEIEVLETQKNHPDVTKLYTIVTLPEDQQLIPVTLTFQDLRGNGKVDMLVHFGGTEIPLYNDGTQFQLQPPASK